MATKKQWITPSEACGILGIQPKALSGIVNNYYIDHDDNPNGRGYVYRRTDVELAAKARGERRVTVKVTGQSNVAPDMLKLVNLKLTGTRRQIRQIAVLLEKDKRFDDVEPEFSDDIDEQYWRSAK